MKLQARSRLQATQLCAAYTGKKITQLVEYANQLCPETLKFPKTYKVRTQRYAYRVSDKTLQKVEHKLKADGWVSSDKPARADKRVTEYKAGTATITIDRAPDPYSSIELSQAT